MAKINGLEKLSFAELGELRNRVDRMMVEKRNSARDQLRQNITTMLKDHGLSIQDLFGKGRKGPASLPSSTAILRTPRTPGPAAAACPLRLTAAGTKGSKAKREEFPYLDLHILRTRPVQPRPGKP